MYTLWPLLSISTIEKIEAKINNSTELCTTGAMLPNFETAATKAQRFLRHFIHKVTLVLPDLFKDYILTKAMPMHMRMHRDAPFIPALPTGRFNKYLLLDHGRASPS